MRKTFVAKIHVQKAKLKKEKLFIKINRLVNADAHAEPPLHQKPWPGRAYGRAAQLCDITASQVIGGNEFTAWDL